MFSAGTSRVTLDSDSASAPSPVSSSSPPMQFQASLAGFKAIVARAGAESRTADQAAIPDSLPLGITKATALDIFSGAMLQLKDKTFVFCELGRNCARDAGRDIELITSVGPQARRKFRKAAWLDANVESVAYKALRPGIWEVGSTPTRRRSSSA